MKPNYDNFKPTGCIRDGQGYQDYLWSSEWKAKRKEAIKRDGGICQCCLRKIKAKRQVHHLSYDKLFDEPLTDLTTLCSRCHSKIHWKYPVPRYRKYKGEWMRVAVPSKELVNKVKFWIRGWHIGGVIPRDADYYADRVLYEVGMIEKAVEYRERG